jgi:hypothetical protein
VNGLCGRIAALLIKMSTRPNSDSALAGECLDIGLDADVGENGDRLDPEIPGLTRDGLSLLLIGARVDHDMRALRQPTSARSHGRYCAPIL